MSAGFSTQRLQKQPAACFGQKIGKAQNRAVKSRIQAHNDEGDWAQRVGTLLMSTLAAVQISQISNPPPSLAVRQPFLSSTGAKGLLAEEEEKLLRLRQEIEGEARQELDRARAELEAEGRETQSGKLCATPFGVDVVGITELIALTGALVGGFSAKQRKAEVERLNDQLRKINMSLRQQARSGTIHAPGLTYASSPLMPTTSNFVSSSPSATQTKPPAEASTRPKNGEPSVEDSAAAMRTAPAMSSLLATMDEDDLPTEERQCLVALREGKRLLKEKHGSSAIVRFEKALMLSKSLGQKIYERRATRGLAASARLQGQQHKAMDHLKRVLELSSEVGDHRGDADVHGTIADILTSLGDFSEAAKYYDKYIQGLQGDF